MYTDSGPDGGSLFGGGGFLPTQSTGLNDHSYSPGRGTKSRGSQSNTLIPLTVRQLSSAAQQHYDDTFYVDGQELHNITLVGMVKDKKESIPDLTFILDDFTGRINVHKWIDGEDCEELVELRNIRNGTYVRVYGQLRSFEAKRKVVAFAVRPITEFDEVTFHFLQAIYVHALNLRSQGVMVGSRRSTVTGVPYNTPNAGYLESPAFLGTPNLSGNMRSNIADQSMTLPSLPPGNSMDECVKRVLALFAKDLPMEQGLHVDEVTRMVGFTKGEVKEALDVLVRRRCIYNTIDDDHYNCSCPPGGFIVLHHQHRGRLFLSRRATTVLDAVCGNQ